MVEELRRLFDKYVVKIQDFKKQQKIKELVPISELNGIRSLCRLFDIFATPKNGVSRSLVLKIVEYSNVFVLNVVD